MAFGKRQPIDEEKALQRLAALCAKSEYCTADADEKMQRWGLGEEARKRVIDYLVKNHYIDNRRYCRAFIEDKITFNHWGSRKIQQALWMKHIPENLASEAIAEVPPERFLEVLRPLLKEKLPTIHADTDYQRDMKLIKFALGRGFTIEEIRQCM